MPNLTRRSILATAATALAASALPAVGKPKRAHEFDPIAYGGRLRQSREAAGLSLDAAAEAVGVSPGQLALWEAGDRLNDEREDAVPNRDFLSYDTCADLIELYDIETADWLFFGDDLPA